MLRQVLSEEGCIRSPFSLLRQMALCCLFLSLLGLGFWFYSFGLSGPFLLDDFNNLATLANSGQVDSWHKLVSFAQSGFAGPTGRPIAMLSFLLDDNSWPSSPAYFKATNILLHLLTGVVLFWLSVELGRALGWESMRVESVALVTVAIWILHPLHVSTVLYVVQRMTILATLFATTSLLCYLLARKQWQRGRGLYAGFLLVGVVLSFILSVFSKENTATLPALLLLFEWVLLSRAVAEPATAVSAAATTKWRRLVIPVLSIGATMIIGYLLMQLFKGWHAEWSHRDFTLQERLLTQPRVLWAYLSSLVMPLASTAGLYHDGFLLSKSWLQPVSTTAALIGWGALLVGSILYRQRFPILVFGLWFYLIAHLIESSVIGLELYYEHRNYFPSIMLALVLSYYLHELGKYRYVIAGLAISVYSAQLAARTSLWADEAMLTLVWSHNAPHSERAQLKAARLWVDGGEYLKARDLTARVISRYPERPNAYLLTILFDCMSSLQSDPKPTSFYHAAGESLRHYRWDPTTLKYFEAVHAMKQASDCQAYSWLQQIDLLQDLLTNRGAERAGEKAKVFRLMARAELARGNLVAGEGYYHRAFQVDHSPDAGMLFVSELANAGHVKSAGTILALAEAAFREQGDDYKGNLVAADFSFMKRQLAKRLD